MLFLFSSDPVTDRLFSPSVPTLIRTEMTEKRLLLQLRCPASDISEHKKKEKGEKKTKGKREKTKSYLETKREKKRRKRDS